jgi:glycosyltransferase involved in cell wall biosynthesis
MRRSEVSVVVPVHNVGRWVRECLSSILDDQDVDLEVIAIDDNSTDDSWSVVAAIADRDARVQLVRSIGTGGAQARNLGVELAHGEYLVFADGDDLVPRGAYARMLASARATGADMVIGNFIKFWSTRIWRPTWKWPAFDEPRVGVTLLDAVSLIRNRACWNRMFRREFWLDQRIYFPSVPRSNDIVPMTKALVSAKHIDVITDDVYLYRGRPGEDSMTARASGLESYTAYLTQELECSSLVTSLGDERLRAEYDDLFLSADGWVHLRGFLNGAQRAVYEKEDLARAHQWLVPMLESLDVASLARLPHERSWVYALAAAGAWSAAGRLMDSIKPASGPRPDAMWFLEQGAALGTSSFLTADALGSLLGETLLSSLVERAHLVDSGLPAQLAAHADIFRRAHTADVMSRLSAGAQQLMQALVTGREDVIRDRFAEGFLSLRPESVALRRGRFVIRAAVTGPVVDELTLYAVSGDDVRRAFPDVRLDADARLLEASIPVSKLSTGRWSLRFAARNSATTVDAPLVIPREVVTRRGRPWTRAVIRPRSTRRHEAVIVVRSNVVFRSAYHVARALRRMVGPPPRRGQPAV